MRGRGGAAAGGRWGGGRSPISAPGYYNPHSMPPPPSSPALPGSDEYDHYYHDQQQQQEQHHYYYQQQQQQQQHQFEYASSFGGYEEATFFSHDYQQHHQQHQHPQHLQHQQQQWHDAHQPTRPSPRRGGDRGRGGGAPPWRRRSLDMDDPTQEGGSSSTSSFQEELAGKPRGGSMEVRNDYAQHFLETGERPQNFIRDATVDEGFAEYPKLARLLAAKDAMVASRRTPPMHVRADLRTFDLRSLGTKFDVIYCDPPWEEYARRAAPFVVAAGQQGRGRGCDGSQDLASSVWSYEELAALPIDALADVPSFLFLWCGSGGRVTEDVERGPLHVDDGRRLLKKWGFRRCEEICWLKTNKAQHQAAGGVMGTTPRQPDMPTSTTSLLVRTKEHCLVGIKGSVRRNRDGHILHCNVHTDIVVAEQATDPLSLRKPEEVYRIIEHFAMGRRRLELFGCPHNIRPGWVTVGDQLPAPSTYDNGQYLAWMREPGVCADGSPCPGHLLGSTPLIEGLRPKTPPREAAAATAAAIGAAGPPLRLSSPSPAPVSPRSPGGPRPGSVAPLRAREREQRYGGEREQQQQYY